jgi:cold shock CspA family protein
MILPLQTTYRNFTRSRELDALIQEEAAKLELFFDRITSCRVLVEQAEHHHRHGAPFHIRIDLRVPGEEIVVNRSPDIRNDAPQSSKSAEVNAANKDAPLAVRTAFREAGRRLQDYVGRKGEFPKSHQAPTTGEVAKIGEEYGFLRDTDGDEIYFHRNSVLDDGFDKLHVGSTVRFVAEAGDQGPQATRVYPSADHSGSP